MASDLISRKSLTEKLETAREYANSIVEISSLCGVLALVDVEPAVDRWIPCSERLPKEEGMYLITSNLFGSLEVQYVFYSENVQMFVCNGTPVAWMPLPSPYKAGDIDG